MSHVANFCIAFSGSEMGGLGHVQRISALSSALKERAGLTFFFQGDSYGRTFAQQRGIFDAQDMRYLKATPSAILVLDCVSVSEELLLEISKFSVRVLLSPIFTSPCNPTHAFLRCAPGFSPPQHTKAGRAWSILDLGLLTPIRELRSAKDVDLLMLHVGVLLSGSSLRTFKDLHTAIFSILSSFQVSFVVDIVESGEIKRFFISTQGHVSPAGAREPSAPFDVRPFFSKIDILVTGDGVTADEACYLGIPTVCVSTPDQMFKVQELVDRRAALCATNIPSLQQALTALVTDRRLRFSLSRQGKVTVDGLGAERVALKLLQIAETHR